MLTPQEIIIRLQKTGSVSKAAKATGVSRQTIYNFIRNGKVSSDILEKLSNFFEEVEKPL